MLLVRLYQKALRQILELVVIFMPQPGAGGHSKIIYLSKRVGCTCYSQKRLLSKVIILCQLFLFADTPPSYLMRHESVRLVFLPLPQ